MRMLFHNWTPPPIMITNEKLNTYPPLFSEEPVTNVTGSLLTHNDVAGCLLFIRGLYVVGMLILILSLVPGLILNNLQRHIESGQLLIRYHSSQ